MGAALDAVGEHDPFFSLLQDVSREPSARDRHRSWDRRTVSYFVSLATREFGVDASTAKTVISVLFSGIQTLPSQMPARPGAKRRQFLEDTYVATVIGALRHLANAPGAGGLR